jgi:hypothetical protein
MIQFSDFKFWYKVFWSSYNLRLVDAYGAGGKVGNKSKLMLYKYCSPIQIARTHYSAGKCMVAPEKNSYNPIPASNPWVGTKG